MDMKKHLIFLFVMFTVLLAAMGFLFGQEKTIVLETERLVKGDLYEYVVMHTTMPGQSQPMRLFERRLVEIWRISEEEYNDKI